MKIVKDQKNEHLLFEARKLLKQGLNIIAVDGHKKAIQQWKGFTEDMITEAALIDQLNNPKAEGIAVICGAVSGNLEVIDFDLKNDLTGTLTERYFLLIPEDLRKKLRIVRTKSGGFHIYYRCEVIDGNKKLASRPASPEELKDTPHTKAYCIIETRGNNGYVVAPPSDGYSVEQANEIHVLSLDERETLLDAARSFHSVHTEERARFTSTGTPFVVSPFDDYNGKADTVSLLVRHGWSIVSEDSQRVYLLRPGNTSSKTSGNVLKDSKLFYCWTSSSCFDSGKAYSPAAVYAMLNYNGDHSRAAKQLIREGYGTRKSPEAVKVALTRAFETDYKFWKVSIEGKGKTHITINLAALVNFLNKIGGFAGYKYNGTSNNIIVQIKDGFVEVVGIFEIKQFLKEYILNLPDSFDGITPDELLEVIYKRYLKYLKVAFFDFLDVFTFDFLRDTKDAAYFPFRNGIVEVSNQGCKFHKYGEFNKVIWRSQMIDRNITLFEDLPNKLDFPNIDYCQFVRKAAGESQTRFEYFISIIGYLLHKYKDPKQAFAVILAEESENEAEGGGTGKGLFVKGIKQLIPTEIFDGKQFSASKAFAFQRVSLDTKLIAIEDAKKGFRFEEMYSFITEGLPVEKKNQKEFYIPFQDCPKFTISTNYVISDEGNHAKRRQKVLEFSNYFNPARTPYDEFGRMLFEDWDADEWNRFYNFMFYCTEVYLRSGILEMAQSEANKAKNIKLKYGEDFLDFFNSIAVMEPKGIYIKDLYNDFIESYEVNPKDYEKAKFGRGLRYASAVLGFDFSEKSKREGKSVQRACFIKRAA